MPRGRFEPAWIWAAVLVAVCGAEPASDARRARFAAPAETAEIRELLRDEPLGGLEPAPVVALSPPSGGGALGRWRFDDCDRGRGELRNVGADRDPARRSAGVGCVDGVIGRAVALAARDAIVYVPDQPHVAFAGGATVAGWFRPGDVERAQTLFRKRAGAGSAFALVLERGRFRFAIELGDGRAAGVSSPPVARRGVFQHVAASYDGRALRLYVDGREVAERGVAGVIASGPGPLVIGNDGAGRRFEGAIDDAVIELRALTAPEVRSLTCVPVEPRVVASPGSASTVPGVPVAFDVAVTNRNSPACPAMDFALAAVSGGPDVSLDPDPGFQERPAVASGTTVHFGVTATPFDAAPGRAVVAFDVVSLDWGVAVSGAVSVIVTGPAGCHVRKTRELMITDLSVVQDPVRSAGGGAWSFQHLIEAAAAEPDGAPAAVEGLLRSFTAAQTIGGVFVPPRPGMQRVLDAWPRGATGALDLARAPLALQAIVPRIDLRDLARGSAGRASFVFAFVEDGFQLPATLMLDYELPAASEADVLAWAAAFHALGGIAWSPRYNAALEAVIAAAVRRGGLRAVSSNEVVFGPGRQFRRFAPSPSTGRLVPAALDPLDPLDPLDGAPRGPGTCDGCHALGDTGTPFQHFVPPFHRGEVALSPFLRGVTRADPVTGERRRFDDLQRRADDLAALVCPAPGPARASLRRGIARIH